VAGNSYILITPARNEGDYIEKTIRAVLSQTILPKKWIVVSDGSTDRTDPIVKRYRDHCDYLQFVRTDENIRRDFASKVDALSLGYEHVRTSEYDFIGNLDADVSFDPHYYEGILGKFHENSKLGIAGGFLYLKHNRGFKPDPFNTPQTVPGSVQLFRRECFEGIGGYIRLKNGGEDWCAEVMARMHGWQVESFPEFRVLHHRRTDKGILRTRIRQGCMDFSVGTHPVFEVVKCLRRIKEKPYVFGALLRMSGFILSCYQGKERMVSDDFVRYLRGEQMERLKSLISKT
jgi:GT2 family glycosyltransferase